MTKQEEIQKEIQEHVEMCLQVTGGIPSKTFAESISKSLLVLLDGLGVVIKARCDEHNWVLSDVVIDTNPQIHHRKCSCCGEVQSDRGGDWVIVRAVVGSLI